MRLRAVTHRYSETDAPFPTEVTDLSSSGDLGHPDIAAYHSRVF
jgi:hypothetical protein